MGTHTALKAMKAVRKFLSYFSNVLEIRDYGDKIEISIPSVGDNGIARRTNKNIRRA
jgi:hypothetical protein